VPTLNVKAYKYVFPVKATVKVVDKNFWAKGDINWDGAIDSLDYDKVSGLFGKKRGDPDFDPNCDLNGDGIIDMRDIGTVAKNLGLTVSEYTAPFTKEVPAGKCVLTAIYKTQTLKTEVEMAETNTKKVIFIFATFFGKAIVR
jgi:hypothetical protein